VVGDDAQAIYSFRAAAVENILGFAERFKPKAEIVVLAQNYRSTQQILDVRQRAHGGGLAPAPQDPDRQSPVHAEADLREPGRRAAQAEYIVRKILATREIGGSLKRHAILFRSSHHSDVLEVELTKRNIPFVKYGGLKFLEAAHVKDMMSVLRWADNPRNSVAGFRVLKLLPGIGPAHAKAGARLFRGAGISASRAWRNSTRRSR
jgi:DNA helicase II / ATP-dependent DNA helicase PcrA